MAGFATAQRRMWRVFAISAEAVLTQPRPRRIQRPLRCSNRPVRYRSCRKRVRPQRPRIRLRERSVTTGLWPSGLLHRQGGRCGASSRLHDSGAKRVRTGSGNRGRRGEEDSPFLGLVAPTTDSTTLRYDSRPRILARLLAADIDGRDVRSLARLRIDQDSGLDRTDRRLHV